MLPNKPRGVPRVNDRRVLNSVIWGPAFRRVVARSAKELWALHDLLQSLRSLGQAGIWDQVMEALAATRDGAVQMIDTHRARFYR